MAENRTEWSVFGDYGSTEQVTVATVNGSVEASRRRKVDGRRKKVDGNGEEVWDVSTEAPGGHHRHHHTQHRDYATTTRGFVEVAASTEASRGAKRRKTPVEVTVKTPKVFNNYIVVVCTY